MFGDLKTISTLLAILAVCKLAESVCIIDVTADGKAVNETWLYASEIKFSLNQFKKLVNESSLHGQNILVSPYSIWQSLNYEYVTSPELYGDKIGTILDYDEIDNVLLDTKLRTIKRKIQYSSDGAFKIFTRRAFDEFVDLSVVDCAVNYFSALLRLRLTKNSIPETDEEEMNMKIIDAPEESRKLLNEWLANTTATNTRDLLKPEDMTDLLKPKDDDVLLITLKSVLFDDVWKYRFDEGLEVQFLSSSGEKHPVPMIYNTAM
ncbi:Uncharacterised protein r2_g853 [Pycnogonum litorale]